MRCQLIIGLFLLINSVNTDLNAQSSKLDLEQIMTGKDFTGYWPENHFWLPNGNILFSWNPENNLKSFNYLANQGTVGKVKLNKLSTFPSRNMVKHSSNSFYAYIKNGRIFKWESSLNNPKLIYQTYDNIYSVQLVKDSNHIYFLKNSTLCKINTLDLNYVEVLKFKMTTKKPVKSNQETYLKNQQLELFNFHKKSLLTKNYNEDFNDSVNYWKRKPIEFKSGKIEDIFISADESSVIYIHKENNKTKKTLVENYSDNSGWSAIKNARPKVGRDETEEKLHLFQFDKDTSLVISINHLSGIYNRPIYLKDYEGEEFLEKSKNPKLVTYHKPIFNEKGDKAIIEIRSLDNKDRWITILDLKLGDLKEIDHQHDAAWIGGPGISGWNQSQGALGWLDNDKSIWYQSEETGYSHLYKKSISKLKKTALTTGSYEVRNAQLSIDGINFYLTLNKKHPGNRGFYHLNHKTKVLTPILENDGNYKVKISPDEKDIAFLYSTMNQPWELYTSKNKPNAKSLKLTNSKSEQFIAYNWRKPSLIQFKGDDSAIVPARLYNPPKEGSNGAGIIFVHGAGYLQNAHNWWSSYFREYMFHNLLCDLGYTVLDIDYRGSEGYGRDWRTSIYRHMGGWDLKDQLSGREFLINEMELDSNKIGIYGGSYGGFITLMALFTEPGKFKCGAALRSVTDWAHYNHEYTSNILNTPILDSLAFKKSSPIYFADNLQDNLLMLHGVMDDNVQFQDIVRLSQRLIELKKENWELALFPIEPHGFKQATSWYDEYRRILKLFEEELNF